MTELIIDNVHVVLSSDFAVTVKQENPFITKNGEYTYDCTLSLTNPINANLYSFLQRINKREAFSTNRRVILIADNRVYCDGTEVITKWTDEKVTIQIVSGNSQLNYFIGSDKKISELDLGSVDRSYSNIMSSIFSAYELGYCFPCFEASGTLYNAYHAIATKTTYTKGDGTSNTGIWTIDLTATDDSEWRALPFLYLMMEKIITALGYTIDTDVLRGTKYTKILLMHNVDTDKFSAMLPGWTCKEFLEEIEKLFNVFFVINYKTKHVDIVTERSYYSTASMVHITNVKDAYEEESDKDATKDTHATGNIGYSLDSSTYFELRRLSPLVKQKATYKTFANQTEMNSFTTDDKYAMVLGKIEGSDKLYMYYTNDNILSTSGESVPGWFEVDQYQNVINDTTKEDLDIELELSPAEIKQTLDVKLQDNLVTTYQYNDAYPISVATIDNAESSTEPMTSLFDYATKSNGSDSKGDIKLCYYVPNTTLHSVEGRYYLAGEYVYEEDGHTIYSLDEPHLNNGYPVIYKEDDSLNFRLSGIATDFYDTTYIVDKTRKVTLESYDPNIYDPRQIFEIRNKRFVCESIEYTIDAQGRKGSWKGIFYPVNVSDVDAEHLWILADGRWRDNGVWLDNGRWLDN